MENKNEKKLEALINLRSKKLEGLQNFREYFERFAYFHLKDVVSFIDDKLEMTTRESLKIFTDHPYQKSPSQFFVMVQLFAQNQRRSHFFLDNSENFPMIMFEGDEFTGSVKSTILFGKKINKSREYSVTELYNKDKVFEIILDFLDTIYSF